MKAVILAAGVGSRLAPLTEDQSKALIAVNGKPLLLHQIDAIRAAGVAVEDVIVVTGHGAESIRQVLPAGVRTIHNTEYATRNSIHTFSLLRDAVASDDLLLLHCDVFFPPVLLREFLLTVEQDPLNSRLMVDASKPLADEEMKAQFRFGVLVRLAKSIRPDRSDGEYLGIAYLSREDLRVVFEKVEQMLAAGQTHVWYDNAVEAAAEQVEIKAHFIRSVPWIEIDTHEDLAKAREMLPKVEEYDRRKQELIERHGGLPDKVVKTADGWYPVLFSDPIAIPLTNWVAKRFPKVTPNHLTAGAILLSIPSAALFYWGTPTGLILGAILFKIAFILDGMDGKLARLTNRISHYAGFYDLYFDQIRTIGCLAALTLGQYRLTGDASWGFIGLGITFAYTAAISNMQKLGSIRNNLAMLLHTLRRVMPVEKTGSSATSTPKKRTGIKGRLWSVAFAVKGFLNRNRIRTVFCSSLETQCLALFVAPLMFPILKESLIVIMVLGLLQIAMLPLHFHGRMRATLRSFGMSEVPSGK